MPRVFWEERAGPDMERFIGVGKGEFEKCWDDGEQHQAHPPEEPGAPQAEPGLRRIGFRLGGMHHHAPAVKGGKVSLNPAHPAPRCPWAPQWAAALVAYLWGAL